MAIAIGIYDSDVRYIEAVMSDETDKVIRINKDTCVLTYDDDNIYLTYKNVGKNSKDQFLTIPYADVIAPITVDTFHLYVQVQTYLMLNSL